MTDPRETLANGTIARVYTTKISDPLPIFAKVTFTPLDQTRTVRQGGGAIEIDQSPTAEGELVIYHYQIYGLPVAEPFVAVDINGTLEWKVVKKSRFLTDSRTGNPWNG